VADLPHLFWETVLLRPYVFFFLTVYFFACTAWFGIRVTLSFLVLGYTVAFFSEFTSTHTGFPYGWYYYIPATINRELWIAGVPFMDSVSYVFMAFSSYSLSLFIRSPLEITRRDLKVLNTPVILTSWRTLLLGVCLFVFIDVIVDPLSLRGDRFFLGKIYGYRREGFYFGIPLSNFGGWFLVGAALVVVLQVLVRLLRADEANHPRFLAGVRWNRLWGPLLYWVIVLGNLGMTFWIGEITLGLIGCAMSAVVLVWTARITLNKVHYSWSNVIPPHPL
jgi:putative membrane protein